MREKYEITEKDFVIGHVGKMLTDQKNQEYLISIFPEIKKIIPEAKLFFVGDGKHMESHRKKAIETGLEDDIIFAGFHSNINEYLQLFDIFCFPSRYEGLSVAAIEAQASGLCVVMSNRISMETAVTSNTTFVGIEKENSMNWIEAISKYKNDATGRGQRCETARREIKDKGYDIHCEMDRLLELYET
jgi:glycosyltransferase involved in cell wall biosynthesis